MFPDLDDLLGSPEVRMESDFTSLPYYDLDDITEYFDSVDKKLESALMNRLIQTALPPGISMVFGLAGGGYTISGDSPKIEDILKEVERKVCKILSEHKTSRLSKITTIRRFISSIVFAMAVK